MNIVIIIISWLKSTLSNFRGNIRVTLLNPENYSQIKSVIDFPADVSLVTPNSNTFSDQVWILFRDVGIDGISCPNKIVDRFANNSSCKTIFPCFQYSCQIHVTSICIVNIIFHQTSGHIRPPVICYHCGDYGVTIK